MSSNIPEIKTAFNGFQTLYETYLPKADPVLVDDLLLWEQENPNVAPFYMVVVFLKSGTNSQAKRDLIFNKTGMIPAIYDNGTPYVANHRLTSEMLEQICKDDDVIEVIGGYTGSIGGWVLLTNIENIDIVINDIKMFRIGKAKEYFIC